jgi:myo-inositol-1-phosphate synthase
MSDNCTPQGIMAILVDSKGREVAHAADFNLGGPGGFSQQEAQRFRAKRILASSVIKNLSSPLLADAIEGYDAEKIMNKMCEGGCNLMIVPIGYDG